MCEAALSDAPEVRGFIDRQVADVNQVAEAVHGTAALVMAMGGDHVGDPEDHGLTHGHGFRDLDRDIRDLVSTETGAVPGD